MKNYIFLILASFALIFAACEKTSNEVINPSHPILAKKGSSINNGPLVISVNGAQSSTGVNAFDPINLSAVNCNGNESDVFIITYRDVNYIQSYECLNESDMYNALVLAGLSPGDAQTRTTKIFHTANNEATFYGETAGILADIVLPSNHLIGRYIGSTWSKFYLDPASCYDGCEPEMGYLNCDEGLITNVQHTAGSFGNVIQSGATPIAFRLSGNCDPSFNLIVNMTPTELINTLTASGRPANWVSKTFEDILFGNITERDFWNTFQFFVAPNHPLFISLNQTDPNCYYMSEASSTLNYIDSTGDVGLSHYGVYGYGDLTCNDDDIN